MASEKNLQELFHETLKDIYFAEKKLLSALPEMANAAQSRELKAAFELHETETEEHVARLEKVFKEIDETPSGKTCDAIIGIIEEGQEVMKEFKDVPALDAGLLARSAGGRALRDRPLRHTQNVGRRAEGHVDRSTLIGANVRCR
jgi:ferritin-like metal-binding protein YciE